MHVEILVPIALFAMIFGIVYVGRTARHREMMAAIEKGMDPGSISSKFFRKRKTTLRDGALLVGVALGLLSGYFLTTVSAIEPALAYLSLSFLLGGIALLFVHSIETKSELNDPDVEL